MVTKVGTSGHISVPELMTDVPSWCRLMAAKINQILRGKTNNIGQITLTASSTTSIITVPIGTFGTKTVFVFEPTTANAAAHYVSSFLVSTKTPDTGTYIITHQSAPHTDLIYNVAYIG